MDRQELFRACRRNSVGEEPVFLKRGKRIEYFSTNPIVRTILLTTKPTKSVICSLLAFLEAIEEEMDNPDRQLDLRALLESEVVANGVKGQGRRAPNHLKRFGLPSDNFVGDKSGRKTPQAKTIMPRLVNYLELSGFEAAASDEKKRELLHATSEPFRSMLGLSLGPIRVEAAGKSSAAIVESILLQAGERGLSSAIAELLVGSKLEICLGEKHANQIADQHKWENGHDDPNVLGDYRVENVAVEVTLVQGPDESHRSKANRITAAGTHECWLIVRSEKIKAWQDYIARAPSRYPGMIRCYGICEFIGQNLTETRWRASQGAMDPLKAVVDRLNELVEALGNQFLPSARVEIIS